MIGNERRTADAKRSMAIVTNADGGLGHYVAHLYAPLRAHFDVRFLTFTDQTPDELVRAAVPSIEPCLDLAHAASADAITQSLVEPSIDLVNVQVGNTVGLNADFFRDWMTDLRLRGIPILQTIHNVRPPATLPVDIARIHDLYRLADGFVVGNRRERERLLADIDLDGRPIFEAPHGPYESFANVTRTRAQARESLDLPPDAEAVLFFGRLRPDKGLQVLLDAFARLREDRPRAVLLIQTHAHRTPGWAAALREIECADDRIRIRRGYAPLGEVASLFLASDIVALPYHAISQSGVLNLARAFRRPAVVTEAFDEAATVAKTGGLVVPAGSAHDLACAMDELLALPAAERDRRGAVGLEHARRYEGWDRNALAVRRAADAVLSAPLASPRSPSGA